MNSHHDAPSEDGLDDAPPCASAYMTSDKRMLIFSDKADAMEWDDSKDLLPLYSLDELNRIVAAKDAEIAKFKEANRELAKSNVRRRDKIVELMLKLDAQPARQVVVMPEPLSRDDYSVGIYGRAMIRGYESCRREVARLNRNPIPVELINRALQTPIGLKEFADREAAQNELRALLGK